MPSPRWIRVHFTASVLVLLSACSEKSPVAPALSANDLPAEVAPAVLVVSDPFLPSSPGAAAVSSGGGEVAYVSLPTGTFPNAISVTIRNATNDTAPIASVLFKDGGFDPIAIAATAGDELELRIAGSADAFTLYRVVVPKRKPPRVVRTNPPKGATDVALNTRIITVFTEPVGPASVTGNAIQLLQGTASVPGTVQPVIGSLFAVEFIPDNALTNGTLYRLVVTRRIVDIDGDSLEVEVTTDFTTLAAATTPPAAGPFSPAASIVTGAGHSCALGVDGTVTCWGANWAGQLGSGGEVGVSGRCPWENVPANYNPFPCSNAPVPLAGNHTFASLTLGLVHTCALKTSGEAYCWGNNAHSELGANEPVSTCNPANPGRPSAPYQCTTVPLRVGGGLIFSSLAAGYDHTCGLRVDGAAYCWGFGFDGALGTGHSGDVSSPAPVLGGRTFSSLTSGASHTCGLTSSGAAYCWGVDDAGQLGSGAVAEARCNFDGSSAPCAKVPIAVTGGLTFSSISAGAYHTCALTLAGRAYCWGNAGSVYSSSDGTYVPSPATAYGPAPVVVSNNLVFASLSVGPTAAFACGVTSDHIAYCWGGGGSDGSTTNPLVPVPVAGNLAFLSVAAGGAHSCGITTDGISYCWGDNFAGQLGAGSSASTRSPVPIRVSGQ